LYGEGVDSGNIIGHVIDATTHLPIAHASVDVMRGNTTIVSVHTDENGIYSVFELEPKPYLIKVRTPHFQSGIQLGVPVAGQTITIDFILHFPPGKVKGQVINAMTMEPIGKATVDILDEDIVIQSVISDEHGHYIISDVIPKSYTVRASAANFQSTTQTMAVLTDQTVLAHLALQPYGNVVGQVIHTFTGQPLAGVCVGMWQNDALITHTCTDENGYYSFNGLGYCHLVAQIPQFKDLTQGIQISPLQTAILNFSLVCVEPSPPTNVRGKMVCQRMANRMICRHRIKWNPSSDPSVTSYRIYRDNKRIGEVSATDSLVYLDDGRKEKKSAYFVTAVNAFEQESIPVSATMKK
jgi:hypothetical protein